MTHAEAAGRTQERTREIHHLIAELSALREHLVAADVGPAADLERLDPAFRDSACNLIHYLALRRHDVRTLQERLATLGLSSLGRAESHVLGAVDTVLSVLRELANEQPPPGERGAVVVDRRHGRALLREHTEALMGPARPERAVRIMVTMPSEAAQDYDLVHELLQQGMDCMRINCAHDDESAWARMIEHLRRAEQALQRKCRIIMDLAGPKLRTGPLTPGPAVLKLRPQRDACGRVTAPARLWLTAQEQPQPAPAGADACLTLPQAWLETLAPGDRLNFLDARDARRSLDIVEASAAGCWAESRKTAYFVPGTQLSREGANGSSAAIGPLPPRDNPIVLHQGDLLILTRDAAPGLPAVLDPAGHVLEPARIGCLPAEAFRDLQPGEHVWFDDGKIGGVIEAAEHDRFRVRITHARPGGEKLRGEKGINLLDSRLDLPALTAKDLQDLRFVASHADMVALSFANSAADVRQLREHIAGLGDERPAVVLKIETRRGFENLPDMLLEAMKSPRCGVMIARGDLAVECGFERMAEIQEEILWICESAHVPVIWATQVLESLAREGLPSRAEITDAAMGDRAECVMLNKGPHIVAAVRVLDDILRRMQAHQSKKSPMLRALRLARDFPSHGAAAAPMAHGGHTAAHSPSSSEASDMSKQVRFGHSQDYDPARRIVAFTAFWNGQMIHCAVGADALIEQFQADGRHLPAGFARHRDAIERVAEALILQGRFEADGSVLVHPQDCEWLHRIHQPPHRPQPSHHQPQAHA